MDTNVEELKILEDKLGFNSDITINKYNEVCENFLLEGDYKSALKYIDNIISINANYIREDSLIQMSFVIGAKVRYILKEYSNTLKYCDYAFKNVKKLDKKIEFKLNLLKGKSLYMLGDRDSSLDYFKKSIDNYESLDKTEKQYLRDKSRANYYIENGFKVKSVYQGVANYYKEKGLYNEAIEYLQKYCKIEYDEVDKMEFVHVYNDISEIMLLDGNTKEALSYALQAFDIVQKNVDIFDKNNSYLFKPLIEAYVKMVHFEKSLEKQFDGQKDICGLLYLYIGISYFDNKDYSSALVNFVTASDILKTVCEPDNDTLLLASNYIGDSFFELKDYISTISFFENELEKRKSFTQIDDKFNILSTEKIAISYNMIGDTDKSIEFFDEIISYLSEKGNISDLENVYNKKALFLYNIEKYDDAKNSFITSIKIIKEKLETLEDNTSEKNEFILRLSNRYKSLGVTFYKLENNTRCENFLIKSINILSDEVSENDLVLADSYEELRNFYVSIDEKGKATEYAMKLYKVYKANFGEINMNTLNSLYELSKLYYKLKKYDDAIASLDKCYFGYSTQLDENDDKIVEILDLLAISAFVTNKLELSIKYNLKIYKLYLKYGDIEGIDIAYLLESIASTYYKIDDYKNALSFYRKVLKFYDQMSTESKIYLCRNIGYTCESLKQYEGAVYYYKKMISLLDITADDYNEKVSSAYFGIYNCYFRISDYENALNYAKAHLTSIESVYGPESFESFGAYKDIANIYLSLKEYDRALKYFNKSIFIRNKKVDYKFDDDISRVYFDMATLYKKQSKLDDAMVYYKMIISIFEFKRDYNNPIKIRTQKEINKTEKQKVAKSIHSIFSNKKFKDK